MSSMNTPLIQLCNPLILIRSLKTFVENNLNERLVFHGSYDMNHVKLDFGCGYRLRAISEMRDRQLRRILDGCAPQLHNYMSSCHLRVKNGEIRAVRESYFGGNRDLFELAYLQLIFISAECNDDLCIFISFKMDRVTLDYLGVP